MASYHAHVSDVFVLDSAEQLDPVAQQCLILVAHLIEFDDLRPVSACAQY